MLSSANPGTMSSPRANRAPSVTSSAGTNASGSLSFLPRYTPKPEPSYIGPAAANEHINHLRDQDQFDPRSPAGSPTNDGAVFGEQALSLLNTFLDALLYNFLTKGHGTSLSHLRPAITEVLKSKLARDALASADEELHGLIGEADADIGTEEELTSSQFGGRSGWAQDWHLEMAFKRMRLRVMVFIRLGDFDDEDEDRFLEDDDRFNGQSQDMDFVASPAAVYLASVLEHIAEQALTVAGEAAFARSRKQLSKRTINEDEELNDAELDGIFVEEIDVEKIALNPSLGRLWRTWKKNYRAMHGGVSSSPPASPQGHYRSRLGSLNEIARPTSPNRGIIVEKKSHSLDRHLTPDEIPEGDVSETDIAANIPLPMSENDIDEIEIMGVAIPLPMSDNDVDEIEIMGVAIPLPMGDNDVDEIEVPGLARQFDEDEDDEDRNVDADELPPRPSSAFFFTAPYEYFTPGDTYQPLIRPRSQSHPTPPRSPFAFSLPSHADAGANAIPADEESQETPLTDETRPFNSARGSVYHDAIDHPDSDAEGEGFRTKLDIWEEKNEDNEDDRLDTHEQQIAVGEKKETVEDEDEKSHGGVVAGAVAGAVAAAALVGGAFATMTGIGHGHPDPTEEVLKDNAPVEHQTIPVVSKEAVDSTQTHSTANGDINHIPEPRVEPNHDINAHSQAVAEGLTAPIKEPEVSRETVDHGAKISNIPEVEAKGRPMSQLQAPLEDSDLKSSSPVIEREPVSPLLSTGNSKLRETQVKLRESQAKANLDPVSPIEDTRPVSTVSLSEKEMVPAPLQMSNHDRTVLEEMNGHDEDLNGIGVARTSNVPIHSHSPSPPPDPQRSYYVPGSNQNSPNQGPFQARTDNLPPRDSSRNARTSSKDRSLVAAEELVLANNASASSRNQALSPLKQVSKAGDGQHPNGSAVETHETSHAVPFHPSPAESNVLKRPSKDNSPMVPPLQTNFADLQTAAIVARPTSSSHSIGGRSTSSTPTGHSAKGSGSSSVVPRNLDKRPSDESKRRDFDSLLKNEQTVKYTLTPEELREAAVSVLSFCGRLAVPG
jgi:hypothetical protein